MARTCTICAHPRRAEIERAHLAGQPFAGIARDFTASADAAERHLKAHLAPELADAQKARDAAGAERTLDTLARITAEAVRLAQKAEKAGDLRTAASVGVRELVRIAELTARLRGEIGGADVTVDVSTRYVLEVPPLETAAEWKARMLAEGAVVAPDVEAIASGSDQSRERPE